MKFDGSHIFKKDTVTNEYGFECTVEGEWLNGVPHGICIMDSLDCRGVITFVHGKMIGP